MIPSPTTPHRETITLGGGCFWCLEAGYAEIRGVLEVVSGYAGGYVDSPTYRQVCDGVTGHAEVVQVSFDPTVIATRDILEIFFTLHDPTTLNRQGNDVGTQYRSAIFYHADPQRDLAEVLIAELNAARIWPDPIVTQVQAFEAFYAAEGYHQHYYRNNSGQPYCQVVIAPKLAKLRQRHAARLAGSVQ